MRKLLFSVLLLAFISTGFTQTVSPETYGNTITINDLKKHLTIVAGAEMEGRETGTEGQRKAAAYLEQQFKNLGLPPVPALNGYQQYYPLHQDSLISSSLVLEKQNAVAGTDFYFPLVANENKKVNANTVVFAGYGIEDEKYNDYIKLIVKGKVVVFFLGEPKKNGNFIISGTKRNSAWNSLTKKLQLAAAKGAAAALIINPAQDSFSRGAIIGSRKSFMYFPRSSNAVKLPHALITHSLARKIVGDSFSFDAYLESAKNNEILPINDFAKRYKVQMRFSKSKAKTDASNVVGIIEGSDKKDEYVFITAHYDHLGKRDGKIYYGADDDGSGTCAIVEIAEAFAKARANGHGPRRTIVCMAVSGEEKGLWGSEYYSDQPFFPLDKTSVDLNIDMIGRIDTDRKTADTLNYVFVVGHDKLSSELPLVNEAVNNKYTQLVLDYKYDDPKDPNRIYFRSDHYNFARKGIPILFFYDGMLKADYHRPTDTVDKIYWELYEKRARMIFYTAWEIANRDAMLKRDIPLPDLQR